MVAVGWHAEEYGSTREHYIKECHELCATCHGYMHMRFMIPNRFRKHKISLLEDKLEEIVSFKSLIDFFGWAKGAGDISSMPDVMTNIPWLDKLKLTKYEGSEKVAVIIDTDGIYRPDPAIYTNVTSLHGVLYNADTGVCSDFHYSADAILS
jgi:hypothetical protein